MPAQITSPFDIQDIAQADLAGQQQQAAITPEQDYRQKKKDKLFNYQSSITRIKSLIDSWRYEREEVESNRRLRSIDLSPKSLRDAGKLLPDETIIPMRMIETNIAREQPHYINYLKNSPRTAAFRCIEDSKFDTQNLESEFTRVMTYPEWDIPFQRCIDGSEVHGIDYVEVVFDPSKPGNVAVEHVGRDNLYYNKDSINLQANDLLIRRYSFSYSQIEAAIYDYQFDSTQAQYITQKCEASPDCEDRNIYIYKVLIKCEKQIYVAWVCPDLCNEWLKAPQLHYVGIQKKVTVNVPVPMEQLMINPLMVQQQAFKKVTTLEDQPLDMFPLFPLVYKETEEQQLSRKKGRVFLDKHKQEGQTVVASAFVNSLVRSSKFFGSVKADAMGNETAAPKQLDAPLVNGGIYDRPIEFWNMPAPDPLMLQSLQYFDVSNSQESGQVNFAVSNRKDSRKTAAEIDAATEQASQLSSTQVSLLSTFLRLVYTFCWKIVQNRAINGHIIFLAQPQPKINMLMQKVEVSYVNDQHTLSLTYDVRPAGDIDVIKRQQKMVQLKQDWPVFSATPLASSFLKEIISTAYPEQASKWNAELEQASQQAQVIQQLLTLIQKSLSPDEIAKLPPQDQQLLQQMLANAQQVAQQGGMEPATQQQSVPAQQ